jgi:hypothetical protein
MKKLSLIVLVLFFGTSLKGQLSYSSNNTSTASKASDWKDKIFIGGNIGASFGNVTFISLGPMVGYKFTPQTIGGVSLLYQYYKDTRFEPEYSTSMYGGGPFARQFVTDEIFLHAQYEMLNHDYINNNFELDRKWTGTGLVGGGYAMDYLNVTFLYILNHDPRTSPYGDIPYVIRVGVGF